MTDDKAAASSGAQLASRPSSSRRLLARKAAAAGSRLPGAADALEALFPDAGHPADDDTGETAPGADAAAVNEAARAVSADEVANVTAVTSAEPAWSADDERAFQALLLRRKTAGYHRRGRDVSGQLITVGTIAPNAGTIVAVIVGIVAERGSLTRAELIDAMGSTAFPHPKAQPDDRGWCQGYVAGALRSGFLSLVEAAPSSAQAA